MVCCVGCFFDEEIKAAIEVIGHKGNCPVCGKKDTWIYDSDEDDNGMVKDMLESVIEIYVPDSELPYDYPRDDRVSIAKRLCDEWNIFSGDKEKVFSIVKGIVEDSFFLNNKIMEEPVGIPELHDKEFLKKNSIMGTYSWDEFKKSLRNINRFHNYYVNLEILREIIKDASIIVPAGETFYRARVSNEKGIKGFDRREMGAPPDDVSLPGRANSKGQSCLYLSNKKETTIKEIRAHAFDYVTIANFKLIKDINILDLCNITHKSPFYTSTDKISFLLNEKILSAIEKDLAKPMSRSDSDLDYLPTQYISDFAKFCGYDGVRYYSTFDKESCNIALFDISACKCTYNKNYLVGNLDYKLTAVNKTMKI